MSNANSSAPQRSDHTLPAGTLHLLWPEDQHCRDTRVQWVVRDLLRRGAVGSVYGLPGTFKSFLMLDVAVCIAHGQEEFLGFPIENAGPVLVIAADDGADTTIDRLRAIARFRLGDSSYDYIALVDRAALLADKKAQSILEECMIRCGFRFHAPPALVIIDTAAMAGAPTEDFGNTYPEKLGWLKQVASQFGCAIVLVDHEAKPSAIRPNLDVRSGGWGSIMKAGMLEFAWSLRKPGNDPRVQLEVSDKRSPRRPRLQLEFGADEGSYSVEWSELSGSASVDEQLEAAVLEAGRPMSDKEMAAATGLGESRIRRARDRLVGAGRLVPTQEASGTRAALYDVAKRSPSDT